MASLTNVEHRNQDATCYVGNLDATCTEPLLLELFSQIGRVLSVHMPKDKLTSNHNGYGFVEFIDVSDAEYAIQIMNMIKLHGRPLRVSKSSLDRRNSSLDVGANLFLGNLDPEDVNEKLLYDTFSSFGTIIKPPKIMRDEMTNQSRGFGFVSYDCFEASDLAIECMHNQFLCNRQITVQYAFKKTSNTEETGQAKGAGPERHGSRAERMLAANNPMKKFLGKAGVQGAAGRNNGVQRLPNTMFASSTNMNDGNAATAATGPTVGQQQRPPLPPPLPTTALGSSSSAPPLPPPPLPPSTSSYSAIATPQPPPLPPQPVGSVTMPPPLPPPPPPLPAQGGQQQQQQQWIQPPPPPPPPPFPQ